MNAAVRKLQIKLLSPSGELLNCINCYAGQVSVFRASSPADLRPYQRALAGVPGPERFAISLDDEPFRADQQSLVGFGEQFLATDGTTAEYLRNAGVPQDSIESILLSFGLEKACHTQCALLSKCEERRVRLLAAAYQSKRIMVLNNPFDPLAHEWRERFAELIISFARTRKQVVVVPLLTYRPECWIDNDLVARIQVGENIQKTVGFASPENDMNTMLKEMRQLLKDKESLQQTLESQALQRPSEPDLPPIPQAIRKPANRKDKPLVDVQVNIEPENYQRFAWRRGYSAGLGVALVLLLSLSFFPLNKPSENNAHSDLGTASNGNPSNPNIGPDSTVPVKGNPGAADMVVAPVSEPAQSEMAPQPLKVAMVLEQYPEEIREAINVSFRAKSPQSNRKPQAPKVQPDITNTLMDPEVQAAHGLTANDAGDFLRMLETASNDNPAPENTDSGPTGIEPESTLPEGATSEDARREQIRQKFLEAIQRAQSRRHDMEQ